MTPRWSRRLGVIAWCCAWLVTATLLLMPAPPSTPSRIDLVAHLGLFALLVIGALSFCRAPGRLRLLALVTASASFGLELMQGTLPWRTFDWADVVANLLGVGLGYGVAILVLTSLLQRGTNRERPIA